MKTLLVLLLAAASFAPYALANKKPKVIYDHTAVMTFHGPKVKDLIEGRSDLYYAGDYTCTPGTDHYAPDCRKRADWIITQAVSYVDIILEDGTEIVVTHLPCDPAVMSVKYCHDREPWNHEKVHAVVTDMDRGSLYLDIATNWQTGRTFGRYDGNHESLKDGARESFQYALLKGGDIEIDPTGPYADQR